MAQDYSGILASVFSPFGRKKKARKPRRTRSSRALIEALEQRAMLTNTLYVNFGDRFGVTMKESEWFNLGLTLKKGDSAWIHGPAFGYAGDPDIKFTPLRGVVGGLNFQAGPQPQDDPYQTPNVITGGFQFLNGPPPPIDSVTQLESSIVEILTREFAPFNIDVVWDTGSRNMADVRDLLASNNPLTDPNAHRTDTTMYDLTKDRGALFDPASLQIDPMTGLATVYPYQDAYVFIGGWTNGARSVADDFNILAAADAGPTGQTLQQATGLGGMAGNFGNFSLLPDPGFLPNPMPPPPNAPVQNMPYADGGGAVMADQIVTLARQGHLGANPGTGANTGIATIAAQVAGTIWGLRPIHDGLAKSYNPFFDANIELLSRSDIMREGPGDADLTPGTTDTQLYGSMQDVAFFTRAPMMLATDPTTGLPNQDVTQTQNSYDQLISDPDIGPGLFSSFTPGLGADTTYITGTGAWDHITVTADPNNAGFALVQVDSFSDANFTNLIASQTYKHQDGTTTTAILSGSTVTTIDVTALTGAISAGAVVTLTDSLTGATQDFVLSAAAAPGDTQLSVNSTTANFGFDVDSAVNVPGVDTSSGLILIELGREDDRLEIDPTLTAGLFGTLQILVYGGQGNDHTTLVDPTATLNATVTPGNIYAQAFNTNVVRYDTAVAFTDGAGINTTIQYNEYDSASVIHMGGFNSMKYVVPAFLGADFHMLSAFNLVSVIYGVAGPTPFQKQVGTSNLEFTGIPTVGIDFGVGNTNDKMTFDTNGSFAVGLTNLSITMGPGFDNLFINDQGGFTGLNYKVTPTQISYTSLPGSPTINYTGVDVATINGGQGPDNFDVTPSKTTAFYINGNSPPLGSFPGDTLTVQTAGIPGASLSLNSPLVPLAPGNGIWTFNGYQGIPFTGIEQYSTFNRFLYAAADAGPTSKPLIQAFNANTHALAFQFYAYEQTFKGGAQVVADDLGGDGIPDVLIVAPGAGRAGEVKVYSILMLSLLPKDANGTIINPAAAQLGSFFPEGATYANGLNLALGDLYGNGKFELITSRQRGVSFIRTFQINIGAPYTFTQRAAWQPYPSTLVTGASIASGNVLGDGKWEVVTGPGSGIATTVKVYSFNVVGANLVLNAAVPQFNAFESTFKGGVALTVADVTGDGVAEIIVGTGSGSGGSRIRTFTANGVMQNQFVVFGGSNAPLRLTTMRPVNLTRSFVYASQGAGGSHIISAYDAVSGQNVDNFFDLFPDVAAGISLF